MANEINDGVMEVLNSGFKLVTLGSETELNERDLKLMRYAYFAGGVDGINIGKILSNSDET